MKPELILQSELLDIVFNDRNKEYGAYSLRKQYKRQLGKSIALTFILASSFCLACFIKSKYLKDKPTMVAGMVMTEVRLKKIEEPKRLETPKKLKTFLRKPLATIANTSIKIVRNEQVDKPVPKNADLDGKITSLTTSKGASLQADIAGPPAEEKEKDGSVIEPKNAEREKEIKPLVTADVMPEFPGGVEAFRKYMLRNLKEPDELQANEKVVVVVKFVVEADGTIMQAEILKSGGRFDGEVLRVVKRMPRWKPGIQNGKFVPVYFNLPVTFTGTDN